jgi:Fe-S-cluster-containing hydrogenase component 2
MESKKLPDMLKKASTRRDFLKGTATAAGTAIALTAIGGIVPKKADAQLAVSTAPKAPALAKKFLFAERQNCTGCRSCEYACTLFHNNTVWPAMARIHVLKYKDIIDVPVLCWQCDDAPCIAACPTTPKSIVRDAKTNGIILNEQTCLGAKCMKCAEACPPQYVRENPVTGQPLICDLCGGDPQCVKACQEQSGDPQGPCLMANPFGFGVNLAYRDVTPEQAGKDLTENMFYPNVSGKRVSVTGKKAAPAKKKKKGR